MDNLVVSLLNVSNTKELGVPARKALAKMMKVRNLLNRYGIIHVSKNKDLGSSQRVPIEAADRIVEVVQRLESDLNQIVFRGEPVHGDFAVKIGDAFLDNVIHQNGVFKSIRDSYSKLQSLEANSSTWKNNPITKRNDSAQIDRLIANLFTTGDKGLGELHQRVMGTKKDKSSAMRFGVKRYEKLTKKSRDEAIRSLDFLRKN